MAILEARDLVVGYGETQIIHGVSLQVAKGEVAALIGPNGAGKSTVMKAIFGVLTPISGTVSLNGEDVTGYAPHHLVRRGMCYVPQTENVFPSLSVKENLEMGAISKSSDLSGSLARVYEQFPLLQERTKQKAGGLSGGERQMVAMGRALMMNPEVLMLDEPSAGLAPMLAQEIFSEIRAIANSGVAVLMIEQNLQGSLKIADRGFVLAMGENRFEGSGTELLATPNLANLYLGT